MAVSSCGAARAASRDDLGRIAYGSGEILTGTLPGRVVRLVVEWCELHRGELEETWARAQAKLPLSQIEPLP